MRTRLASLVVIALLYLSGICSLVYQIIWFKQVSLIIGSTASVTSTVVGAFMAGLGAGSWIGGKVCQGRLAPKFLYIYATLASAVLSGLTFLTLSNLPYSADINARWAIAFFVILISATPMGATLPAAVAWVFRSESGNQNTIATLYAWNVFGAVSGTALSCYWLIPNFGLRSSMISAVVFEIGCAFAAYMALKTPTGQHSKAVQSRDQTPNKAGYILLFVMGLISIAFEVVMTRRLTHWNFFGLSVFAYANVLMLMLGAMAIGSLAWARVAKNVNAHTIISWACWVIGASMMIGVWLYFKIEFNPVGLRQWTYGILGLPALGFGLCFPALISICKKAHEDDGAGYAIAANTAGAVLGGFLASHVLMPYTGADSVLIGSGILVTLLPIALRPPGLTGTLKPIAVGMGLLTAWVMFTRANPYKKWPPLFYADDEISTVHVYQANNHQYMRMNGKVVGSNSYSDNIFNKLLIHAPMLSHPNPQSALHIGVATGISTGTITLYDPARVDAVDISPAVIEASRLFQSDNFNIHQNPKVRLKAQDGRFFINSTQETYDVIISLPMHLNLAGTGNLFTDEYFKLAKTRLNEGGVMGQWVPFYSLGPKHVLSATKTFSQNFKYVQGWLAQDEIILVGSDSKIDVSPTRLKNMWPKVSEDLLLMRVNTHQEFMSRWVLTDEKIRKASANGKVNTDDNVYIEYHAGRLREFNVSENKRALLNAANPAHLRGRVDESTYTTLWKAWGLLP